MKPAAAPRAAHDVRLLVVDASRRVIAATDVRSLPEVLQPGDLVVVNDAATLPASLPAETESGEVFELRLASAASLAGDAVRFSAALLGAGDHRTRTEDRPPPPRVAVSDVVRVGRELVARVVGVASFSERLVDLDFALAPEAPATTTARPASARADRIWTALYRVGKPVQYAHVPRPLALWDVQNAWAARPWAVEMPSAGRSLGIEALVRLRARGIEVASVTHAAGLSSTGDPEIDARLPLPERFEVSAETAAAVARTKARGGRVVAIGTSVVRALESAARLCPRGALRSAAGIADLLLGPDATLAVTDAVLTGVHEASTTHFMLLGAFADRSLLEAALGAAEHAGFLGHELGDVWLVTRDAEAGARAVQPRGQRCGSNQHASPESRVDL